MPLSSRPLIACLLLGALPLAAGCDRKSPDAAQANAAAPANTAASPDEATGAAVTASTGCVDVSHAGQPIVRAASQTSPSKPNTSSPDEATKSAPTSSFAVGCVDRSHAGQAAPTVAFQTADGKPQTLASYKGKPLLLNLWATWCAPCVKEMPTLDALAAREAGRLVVLPVAQDMDGAAKVVPFLAKEQLKVLKPALDPKMALSLAYQANLPTSILFGSDGREVWRYTGDLDWAGAKAKTLLAEAK